MKRLAAIFTLSTAAVIFGGGFASASTFGSILTLTGTNPQIWGKSTTYATMVSVEWTPAVDSIVCDVRIPLSQATGNRTDAVTFQLRGGMTTNPITGGTLLQTATIPAASIGTSETIIHISMPNCPFFFSGTKYSFTFTTAQDNTNYLYYYYGNDQMPNTQRWVYVPTGGWAADPTKEIAIELDGSDNLTLAATSTNTCASFDPDEPLGKTMCNVFWWMFNADNETAMGVLNSSKEAIAVKAPFAWFNEATSTLGGLNTGDTTTSTVLYMSTGSTTAISHTFAFFDATTISSKIPDAIKDNIKTVGAVAMWAMFFMWIVSFATTGDFKEHTGFKPVSDDYELMTEELEGAANELGAIEGEYNMRGMDADGALDFDLPIGDHGDFDDI